uniref:SAWADEE domain-containing protein n=1 Tax=Davidia involucrata TaxID=16924 RepID=A0A5B7B8A9_DAVIN
MAISDSNCTADDAVELEAMRKEDSSWHPCQVSLSSSGVGLIVDYGSNDSEDIIMNKEEAFMRLRIRSVPLQGDDCSHIQQGEHVLATEKSQSKSLFFDAEVEKVVRVRHSKKVHCRCTFMIKWLHQDLKGRTLTVRSISIKKLATKGINVHPMISAFLNTVETLNCSSTSPLATIVEDVDYEMDLHDLLEKQIEEIRNAADASKKKISEDILLGVEVDTRGQIQCRSVAASKVSKSNVQIPLDQNHLKRSTRSRNKLQREMEVKDPPPTAPSIQEELSETRSPLNPLAARAALASLMSKLPENLEFSIYHEEEKGCTYLSDDTTHKHVAVESLNGIISNNSSIGDSLSISDKLSLVTAATSVPLVPDPNKVKSHISTLSTPGKPQVVDVSSGILTKEKENENKTSEITTSIASFTCLIAERKLSQPTKATRLTRSATKKDTGIPNDDTERKTCVEEMKLQPSTNTRRITRSAVHKEKKFQTMEVKQAAEDNISAKYTESVFADQNVTLLESYVLKEEKSVASPLGAEIELFPEEERNSLTEKEKGKRKHDVKRKTCAEEVKLQNSTNLRSLTLSSVYEEKRNKIVDVKGLEEDKLAQNMKSNSSEGIVTVPDHNALETKELNSLLLDAEEGIIDKGRMSSAVKTTRKTEGKVAGNGESSQGLKRKSTTSKQELRFSPRLRFLPRTRSQK